MERYIELTLISAIYCAPLKNKGIIIFISFLCIFLEFK